MRSPLEHEPELVAGVGLITVRWAALERELAGLLGSLFKIEPAGERAYYATANFSQRIDLIEALLLGSLNDDLPQRIAKALFDKIRRLWKKRNYLIHSHYVYAEEGESGHGGAMLGVGRKLGPHPKLRFPKKGGPLYDSKGEVYAWQERTVRHGFAYEKRGMDGGKERVFVNKGTFDNHAAQISKRLRQVRRFKKAVQVMEAPLRWGSFSGALHTKCSPRGLRNQRYFQARQELR